MEYETANSKQQTANSKQQTANSKQHYFRVFFTILITSTLFLNLKGQPPSGVLRLQNCWQDVDLSTPGVKYILPHQTYNFSYLTALDIDYVYIIGLDAQGNVVPMIYDDLEDEIFKKEPLTIWRTNGGFFFGDAIDVLESGVVNQNKFMFPPEMKTVKISTVRWNIATEYGGTGKYVLSETITLEMLGLGEALDYASNDGCFTFDDFKLNVTNKLSGFCGNYIFDIERDPADITDPDLASNYHRNMQVGETYNLTNFDDDCDDCGTIIVSSGTTDQIPDPVPCKCEKFRLHLKLEPCGKYGPPCEAINDYRSIEICCDCDIRGLPIEGGL